MAADPIPDTAGHRSRRLPPAVATALGAMAAEEPVTVTVRGGCMEPWLSDGERVAVERRRVYWPGDVVAFEDRHGRLTVHRVIGWRPARGGLRLLTQADAAPRADASVALDRVVGRAAVPVSWRQRLGSVLRLARWLATGVAHRRDR